MLLQSLLLPRLLACGRARCGAVLLGGLLALVPVLGRAQATLPTRTAPAPYDFLTVMVSLSSLERQSIMLLSPPFQGKSQVQLEEVNPTYNAKDNDRLTRNTALVQQQLTDLTVAGWELVQVYPSVINLTTPPTTWTTYLFRKARP